MFEPQEENFDNGESMFSLHHLFDYFEILVRRIGLIAATFLVITLGTFIYVLLATPLYEATVQILPETSISQTGGSGNLGALGALMGISQREESIYAEIISSHNFSLRILNRKFDSEKFDNSMNLFDILNIKGNTDEERTYNGYATFNNMIEVEEDVKKGITAITIQSPEPKLSAEIANAVAEVLDTYVREGASKKARENRLFIESRIEDTQLLLRASEENVKKFRETNKRIENSPELQLQEGRLIRELNVQNEVYLTLKKQYEIIKIEEVKNLPTIRVLDNAFPPLFKSKPKPRRAMIISIISGLILGISFAFIQELLETLLSKDEYKERINLIFSLVKKKYKSSDNQGDNIEIPLG